MGGGRRGEEPKHTQQMIEKGDILTKMKKRIDRTYENQMFHKFQIAR